jgi:hypothetical protein
VQYSLQQQLNYGSAVQTAPVKRRSSHAAASLLVPSQLCTFKEYFAKKGLES